MSTLFTLSTSWHEATWLYEKLAFASAGDAVLLIEDAVLASHSVITLASFVAKCEVNHIAVYVLQDDLMLRGLENQYSLITEVDYAAFVDLAAEHNKQIAW